MGGLPVIAEVWFSGPDYHGEYDAGVDALYWVTHKGKKGKQLSEKVMAKIEKRDPYWQSHVVEQVSEQLAHEKWEAEERKRDERDDFIQLWDR